MKSRNFVPSFSISYLQISNSLLDFPCFPLSLSVLKAEHINTLLAFAYNFFQGEFGISQIFIF